LFLLGCVDAVEAHLASFAIAYHGDGITIEHTPDTARRQFPARMRMADTAGIAAGEEKSGQQ
jgi:hypothetical protein